MELTMTFFVGIMHCYFFYIIIVYDIFFIRMNYFIKPSWQIATNKRGYLFELNPNVIYSIT